MLNKEKFKVLIDLTKRYYATHNTELIDTMIELEQEVFGEYDCSWAGDIITGITCKSKTEPYETYYKVFEVLGYEIE